MGCIACVDCAQGLECRAPSCIESRAAGTGMSGSRQDRRSSNVCMMTPPLTGCSKSPRPLDLSRGCKQVRERLGSGGKRETRSCLAFVREKGGGSNWGFKLKG